MENSNYILTLFCIDKRFDYLTTDFFEKIGYRYNYYLLTTAGSSLSLGYKDYCNDICKCSKKTCDPDNDDMNLFANNIIKNIEIALSLDPFEEVYLLNHQDCGAIKAYLSCSNYPQNLGDNNRLEIEINVKLLTFAKKVIEDNFKDINVRIGLIDINGSVCDYNTKYCTWNLIFRGGTHNPKALWFGL